MQFAKTIIGRRLTLECHQALKAQAEWLLNLVDDIVRENGVEVFKDGYKIEVGWSVLTIGKRSNGEFAVLEPDFSNDPFRHVRDELTCTLSVQAEQNDFSMEVGMAPVVTSFQDKVVYSKSCLDERSIYLERTTPRPDDSGWFIGPTRQQGEPDDPSKFLACYAYELLELRPEVMKVLQLPPGYLVVFDGSEVKAILTADNKKVFPQ